MTWSIRVRDESQELSCQVIGLQARVSVEPDEINIYIMSFFARLWCPQMAPDKIKNGAQCCFSNFDSRLFRSKFLVKLVSISRLSFILSHFHKSSHNLLQEIYLVLHMPKK